MSFDTRSAASDLRDLPGQRGDGVTDNGLLRAALAYAEWGWPVFPCSSDDKSPLTAHGFKNASANPSQIREWWRRWPEALIGVPVGRGIGGFVVDLDPREASVDAMVKQLTDFCGADLTASPRVRTQSGGLHLWFRMPDHDEVSNRADLFRVDGSLIGPAHVDVRGEGGYVIVPPSRMATGKGYVWERRIDNGGFPDAPDAPQRLLDLILRRGEFARDGAGGPHPGIDPWTGDAAVRRYARSALAEETAAVASAPSGSRNHRLNVAAFSLGQLVGAGALSENTVRAALADAAVRCGLVKDDGWQSVRKTIASGLTDGKAEPRDLSEVGRSGKQPRLNGDDSIGGIREGDGSRQNGSDAKHARYGERARSQVEGSDGPLPLFPPPPPAEPHPVEALGPVLADAVRAIARKIQVPHAIAAGSILSAASLAAQALADVLLPFGQTRPLSLYFMTVAGSGDRKTTADGEALWPVREREKLLREIHRRELETWFAAHAAWEAEKQKIRATRKIDREARRLAFFELGPEPERPLEPILTAPDPTVEGLARIWPRAHAALGLFSAEGGQLIGGHGFNKDNILKTAAAMSELWDGREMRRLRAGDGLTVLPGRRLAMHVMVQPEPANGFLSDALLRDQGLLSRFLIAAPESLAGTRCILGPNPADEAPIRDFGARMLALLEAPLPLAAGKANELIPPALSLSEEAEVLWYRYADQVERRQLGPDGDLVGLNDVASKSAEQAARIAGVLTIVRDRHAEEIDGDAMQSGIIVAQWYLSEALRLRDAGRIDPRLLRAQALLDWVREKDVARLSVRDVMRGPRALRAKAAAEDAIKVLVDHGHLVLTSERPRIWALVSENTA